MTKRIQPTEKTLRPIRDSGASLPRIEAAQVRRALGAEAATEELEEALAPVTLFALRQELLKRLQSTGGRPALEGVTRRAKVPLSHEEWVRLEALAAAISSPGFAPSAGQIASVLLTLSLHAVTSPLGGLAGSSLARELAARATGEAPQGPAKSPA